LSKRKDLAATALRTLLVLWTVMIIFGVYVAGNTYIKDQVYNGTEITFDSATLDGYHYFAIEDPATVEVSSDHFFVFRNGQEFLIGLPSQPPADWESGNYFYVKQDVSGDGEWWGVLVDTVDLRVTSDELVTVRLIPNYAGEWLIYGFVAFLVWIVGILLFATMI